MNVGSPLRHAQVVVPDFYFIAEFGHDRQKSPDWCLVDDSRRLYALDVAILGSGYIFVPSMRYGDVADLVGLYAGKVTVEDAEIPRRNRLSGYINHW